MGTVGLKQNVGKSDVLARNYRINTPIKIQGPDTEMVHHFPYLGSMEDERGGTERDVLSRLSKARVALYPLSPVFSSKALSTIQM